MVFSQSTALIGLILNLIIAIFAFKKGLLNAGGTVAAIIVGELVFSFGGWTWLAVLIFFFVSSNFFTHYRKRDKASVQKEFAKGNVRDFWQVMANGGVAALLAVVYSIYPQPVVFIAFLGVVGTVTADTWATELGVLSQRAWSVASLKRVRVGTSGAVSLLGLAASFAAGVGVALFVFGLDWLSTQYGLPLIGLAERQFTGGWQWIFLIGVTSFFGSLVDSVLGARMQTMFYCEHCKKETERREHSCGRQTRWLRGFGWMDNDGVNFLSSLAGALIAAALFTVF